MSPLGNGEIVKANRGIEFFQFFLNALRIGYYWMIRILECSFIAAGELEIILIILTLRLLIRLAVNIKMQSSVWVKMLPFFSYSDLFLLYLFI